MYIYTSSAIDEHNQYYVSKYSKIARKVVMRLKWKCLLGVIGIILLGTNVKAYDNTDTYIVDLKKTVSFYSESQSGKDYHIVTEEELKELLEMDIVEYYEPNYEVKLLGDYWNLDAIETEFAWDMGCYGNDVRIAVIDSGCSLVGDIDKNVDNGYNYINQNTDTTDNVGHGTFVSGIIASQSNGISYKSKIIPLKCFDTGVTTTVSDIIGIVYDAVDIYNCDVINMSIGFTGYSTKLARAITYATSNGVIVVSAVGNDGEATKYYPAAYDNVIGVASVNKNKEYSEFSQFNNSVFVCAPGEDLESLSIESYTYNSGTSFAAPHVTAMAAIAKCIDDDISVNKFKELLIDSSTDLGASGYDIHYGYGLINIKEFIKQAIDETSVFMFPINQEDNEIYSVIYNNSDTDMNVTCISAEYENSKMYDCKMVPVLIPSGQTYIFQNLYSGKAFKYMVWNNLKTIKPLVNYRTYEKKGDIINVE